MIMAIHDGDTETSNLETRLETLELKTHFDARSKEPISFLESVAAATGCADATQNAGPTPQEIECLRQAAWKYCRQTASDVATARDLSPVLHRLGYV